jgi:hypothetical protein
MKSKKILQMKLSYSSKSFYLIIYLTIFSTFIQAEDTVDIWNNKKIEKSLDDQKKKLEKKTNNNISLKNNLINKESLITEISTFQKEEEELYGLFDPEENDLNLSMWQNTDGKDIKEVFSRINKMKLSSTASDIFSNLILTFSYPPKKNITEEEFLNLKINWLISNKKDILLKKFLEKNKNFKIKKKLIQYFVDKNIAEANISKACDNTDFISKEIKDSYLEKFKIYCLIFNDKKNEAQLIYDILKEQDLSDKFFDTKINYLLGINEKKDNKVNDNNLLNFYLSSVTVNNFNYEPTESTDKYIWEYINAANLIVLGDYNDQEKIKSLEISANKNSLNKQKIFEIYKKISFDLNQLINAENVYQSLNEIEGRALIFQKYLLVDKEENKIKLLFLLKDLFKKSNLSNVFYEFMSDELKKIDSKNIPESYVEVVKKNIISKEEFRLGKIKYDDKVLHRSRIIRFYTEKDTPIQKSQKDLNNVYKKIKRNKDYFFSAKDLVLVESLEKDGLVIPKGINQKETAKKYNIPGNLLDLFKNGETGMLILKFVEIIGQDEVYDLDPETIYFITNILNQAKLIKFRNNILITALPLRN